MNDNSKNDKIKKKLIKLKSLGTNKIFLNRKTPGLYDCDSFGLNLRMDEINSAIGKVQIRKIKPMQKREKNFRYLCAKLKVFLIFRF